MKKLIFMATVIVNTSFGLTPIVSAQCGKNANVDYVYYEKPAQA